MLTLVPPSRLGSPLAFAVIDRKSSTVFLSTFSAVVALWSTSFPSGSLLSSVLLECENTMKAACLHRSLPLGWESRPCGGGGQLEKECREREPAAAIWKAFPSAIILLPKAPSIHIHGCHVAERQGQPPLHLSFLVSLGVRCWCTRIHWTNSEKNKLVEIGAS